MIGYTSEDFTSRARGYDLILDTAGNRPLTRLRRALTPHGTLVIIGGEARQDGVASGSRDPGAATDL